MQCGVCVCGPSKNARGGQWGREALVPIPQFLSIVVTHASTRGAFLPLCHVLPPMSKRLVGRIFISSDIVNRTPLIGAFKRLQENANRSERFRKRKSTRPDSGTRSSRRALRFCRKVGMMTFR